VSAIRKLVEHLATAREICPRPEDQQSSGAHQVPWLRAPDNAGYRWLGRPAVTLKVCRGDRGRNAGLLPARPNWMRTMTLEQTASLRADVIKLNPLIAYNPPWRG